MTTTQTTDFRATTAPARAGFAALAMAITFALLYSVGQVADQQYDQAHLAQTSAPVVALATPAAHG